jgi:outer membrane protein OmpA-like peptidoglycan-associated protein
MSQTISCPMASPRFSPVGATAARTSRTLTALLAVAALAGVSGCATRDAVSEQTDPLKAQVSKLDEALQASRGNVSQTQEMVAAAQARELSLVNRVDRLFDELKALHDRLATQEQKARSAAWSSEEVTAGLRDQLAMTGRRLDELASQARDLAARADADDAQLANMAAAAALRSEQMAQSGQRLDGMAAQLAAGSDEDRRLRQDIALGAEAAARLSERVARAESALERLGDNLPDRMSRLETRMDELARLARSAMELAAQNDIRRNGKVAFTTVLTGDKTLYPLNLQTVGAQDRAALEGMVQRIRAMNKEYHLEIQGHTDNTSADDSNYQLGKARAEVIKRYLHETGGIPLGWMSVISYGATQPLDQQSNSNRRIVIQTLVLDGDKD